MADVPLYLVPLIEQWQTERRFSGERIPAVYWDGSRVVRGQLRVGSVIQSPANNHIGCGLLVNSTDDGSWLEIEIPKHTEQSASRGKPKTIKHSVYSVDGAYSTLLTQDPARPSRRGPTQGAEAGAGASSATGALSSSEDPSSSGELGTSSEDDAEDSQEDEEDEEDEASTSDVEDEEDATSPEEDSDVTPGSKRRRAWRTHRRRAQLKRRKVKGPECYALVCDPSLKVLSGWDAGLSEGGHKFISSTKKEFCCPPGTLLHKRSGMTKPKIASKVWTADPLPPPAPEHAEPNAVDKQAGIVKRLHERWAPFFLDHRKVWQLINAVMKSSPQEFQDLSWYVKNVLRQTRRKTKAGIAAAFVENFHGEGITPGATLFLQMTRDLQARLILPEGLSHLLDSYPTELIRAWLASQGVATASADPAGLYAQCLQALHIPIPPTFGLPDTHAELKARMQVFLTSLFLFCVYPVPRRSASLMQPKWVGWISILRPNAMRS